MRIDSGFILIDIDELVALGPYCTAKEVRLGEHAPFITRAIAYCYADWCAQQRMDDDGCPLHVVQ